MSYNERMADVLNQLGLDVNRHLPPYTVPRTVRLEGRDVRVWVAPTKIRWANNGRRFKSSQHRVMCECPACGHRFSAGRFHQHIGTAACFKRAHKGTVKGSMAAKRRCADCGQYGEQIGHMGCQFPRNHD